LYKTLIIILIYSRFNKFLLINLIFIFSICIIVFFRFFIFVKYFFGLKIQILLIFSKLILLLINFVINLDKFKDKYYIQLLVYKLQIILLIVWSLSQVEHFFLNLIHSLGSRRVESRLRCELDSRVGFRRVNAKNSS